MPPTDPGLDERVCRKLGWEPRWRCEDCDQLNEMKDTRCRAFQRVDYCGWPREKNEDDTLYWPPVSTSWEWAGKALEELFTRSPRFLPTIEAETWTVGSIWHVTLCQGQYGEDCMWQEDGRTGPEAIARAIDAALAEVEP